MAESWLVLRCSACNICHGRKSTGHLCPHCGQRVNSNSEVVDTAINSNELRTKVVLANTPLELRELLKKKLSSRQPLVKKEHSSAFTLKIIKESVDSNSMIYMDTICKKLITHGITVDVEQFMESVESQGLIMRIESGIWQFLE